MDPLTGPGHCPGEPALGLPSGGDPDADELKPTLQEPTREAHTGVGRTEMRFPVPDPVACREEQPGAPEPEVKGARG